MWGVSPRTQNHHLGGDVSCWDADRENKFVSQPLQTYFDDIFHGKHCQTTDWYENSPTGNHGWFRQATAPALLGFDNDIDRFCHGKANCDLSGYNILNLFGHIGYNSCRNFGALALNRTRRYRYITIGVTAGGTCGSIKQ